MGAAAILGLCLLLCLALPPPLRGVPARRCPPGWLHFRGHCYGYFGRELSWRQAEARCGAAGAGGHLASLLTPPEHRAVAAFVARCQRRHRERESVWIGLVHRAGGWSWADGSALSYSAWDGDDPPRGTRCAALEDSAGFLAWEDEPCGEQKPFVCKHAA